MRPRPDHENLHPVFVEFGWEVHRRALVGMRVGCGCRSLSQLRRWFTQREYRTLLRFGYTAVRMDVGRILAESATQCVFERVDPLHVGVEEVDLYPTPCRHE